ncbi:hypothetical protein J32TS6_20440 [Virgibacillus pantothenticus]|nr:hypothetical protein J32TS6_20440 [Virgibacillus pantothenticus]
MLVKRQYFEGLMGNILLKEWVPTFTPQIFQYFISVALYSRNRNSMFSICDIHYVAGEGTLCCEILFCLSRI